MLRIETGTLYELDLPCPNCGVLAPVPVMLTSVLTLPQGEELGTLRPKLSGDKLRHACARRDGQMSLADLAGVHLSQLEAEARAAVDDLVTRHPLDDDDKGADQ